MKVSLLDASDPSVQTAIAAGDVAVTICIDPVQIVTGPVGVVETAGPVLNDA